MPLDRETFDKDPSGFVFAWAEKVGPTVVMACLLRGMSDEDIRYVIEYEGVAPAKFINGDEAYWVDPDCGMASRYVIIDSIIGEPDGSRTIYRLTDGTEVFEHELE